MKISLENITTHSRSNNKEQDDKIIHDLTGFCLQLKKPYRVKLIRLFRLILLNHE